MSARRRRQRGTPSYVPNLTLGGVAQYQQAIRAYRPVTSQPITGEAAEVLECDEVLSMAGESDNNSLELLKMPHGGYVLTTSEVEWPEYHDWAREVLEHDHHDIWRKHPSTYRIKTATVKECYL